MDNRTDWKQEEDPAAQERIFLGFLYSIMKELVKFKKVKQEKMIIHDEDSLKHWTNRRRLLLWFTDSSL